MKMTLLEMTQNILNAMDSDDVNTISETVESEQVVEIIKETYYDLIATKEFPEHFDIRQLEGLSDATRPNYLQIPDDVYTVEWWKYNVVETGNTSPVYKDVTWMEPKSFINMVNTRNPSDSTIDSISDSSGIVLLIRNDRRPNYYTSFNADLIVCDSYDSAVDSTLQQSKTQAWCETEPTWTSTDSFIPDLDTQMFPLLLAESKSVAYVNLKQMAAPKEEKRARKHRQRSSKTKWRSRVNYPSSYGPDYGRRKPG